MSSEGKQDGQLEIAHVLFIDIVGYSKLPINRQSELLQQLNQIVRATEQFRRAEAADKLVRLPTGDGMALAFFTSPDAPVRCALEISKTVGQALPPAGEERRQAGALALQLRMGINSGPVDAVSDVNDKSNVAGAGINMAQRIMDCGDAGHILLAKRVADDLGQYENWQPYLHELGVVEVKHGVRVEVVNFYNKEVGNPELPAKIKQQVASDRRTAAIRYRKFALIGVSFVIVAAAITGLLIYRAQRHSSATTVAPDKSIAVLPFENLSADNENAFFSDGVQNEILTDLAKIADLKVISRTSVLAYKAGNPRNLREIAQQLGVAHVLEGSVQRSAGKVRVNAQLIDARTDKHLWAQTYDRALSDVFAIETEVAQAIANELQAKLSAGERVLIEQKPTQNLAAYDFYVRAVPLIDGAAFSSTQEKDLFQAVDLLNQAVALDPGFLLAYCWLARAHDSIYFFPPPPNPDHTPARLALAKSAIDTAFGLQPDSGEAHLAMAWHVYWGSFDYDHARAEVELAARTLPNSSIVFQLTGLMDRRQGRWAEAVRNLERASELDPRNENSLMSLITTYEMVQDYNGERKAYDRWQLLKPNDLRPRLGRAAIERDERADIRPWREEMNKLLARDPKAAEQYKDGRFYLAMLERDFNAAASIAAEFPEKDAFEDGTQLGRDFYMGVVARLKGDAEKAKSALTSARLQQEQIVRAHPDDGQALCGLATIDAELHRKEEALNEGKKAIELMANYFFERPGVIADFALVCAQLGERDLAIEQLNLVANKPNGPTYGWLRLSPFLDPLRGDPRFEKIAASLAPKDATPK
jgi:TolB-like protein/class 3 adenylate cyclase